MRKSHYYLVEGLIVITIAFAAIFATAFIAKEKPQVIEPAQLIQTASPAPKVLVVRDLGKPLIGIATANQCVVYIDGDLHYFGSHGEHVIETVVKQFDDEGVVIINTLTGVYKLLIDGDYLQLSTPYQEGQDAGRIEVVDVWQTTKGDYPILYIDEDGVGYTSFLEESHPITN